MLPLNEGIKFHFVNTPVFSSFAEDYLRTFRTVTQKRMHFKYIVTFFYGNLILKKENNVLLHFWTRFPASKRFRVFLVRTFVNFYWHQKAHEKKVNNCFFLTLSKTRYGDFNISNGWGMRSTKAIHLIFERNLSLIIIHHPAKFHQNLSRTFWDNRYKESQTHTQHTQTHTCGWK